MPKDAVTDGIADWKLGPGGILPNIGAECPGTEEGTAAAGSTCYQKITHTLLILRL